MKVDFSSPHLLALIPLIVTLLIFIIFVFRELYIRNVPPEKIFENPAQVQSILNKFEKNPNGIFLHPKIQISDEQESKHFLILGGSGSGKTLFTWKIFDQVVSRGDHVIVFDYKNEYANRFPSKVLPLEPWAGGLTASAKPHLKTQAATDTFIQDIVISEDSANPMWKNAAEQVLVDVIDIAKKEKGSCPNWQDIVMVTKRANLAEVLRKHKGVSAKTFSQKQTDKGFDFENQVLSSFSSRIADLTKIADYKAKAFDLEAWINTKQPSKNVLKICYDEQYASISRLILRLILRQVLFATKETKKPRKVWLFLDEFVQIGKLDDNISITKLLEVGRSMGIRLVLISQSTGSISKHYSQGEIRSIFDNTGTKTFGRQEGESAEDLSRFFGMHTVKVKNYTKARGKRTISISEKKEPRVPTRLFSDLGTHKRYFSLLLSLGHNIIFLGKFKYPKKVI